MTCGYWDGWFVGGLITRVIVDVLFMIWVVVLSAYFLRGIWSTKRKRVR